MENRYIVKILSNTVLLSIVTAFAAVVAFHCAGQMAPSGGPPDTTPPTVVETYPAAKTTSFHDNAIRIRFDKWIEKRSVDESIFISPNLGELTLDWSGKEVEIKFTDSLRENTTYVVTLGTDVKDLLAGNNMASAFSLAFSTGDHIDSASLSGRIFDEKPEGIMLFAYLLDTRNGDTLNPSTTKPDYLTQTGKDGTFYLPYLRLGTYRVVAIRDEYKNLFYEAQTDQYGVPQQEFRLTANQSFLSSITISLTTEDTTAPFLSSSRAIDQQHVLLRFSELIDTSTLRNENISIYDTLTHAPLSVIDASPSDSIASEALLLTGEQDSTKTYRVMITGISDLYGNTIPKTSKPSDFDGSATADTTNPTIKILNLMNDAGGIYPGDTIKIALSEWVIKSKFERGFSLEDTAKKPLDGNFRWQNSIHALFTPYTPLKFNMPYVIKVSLDSLIDVTGNRRNDSTRVFKIQVVDKDKLGTISGIVVDSSTTTNGNIIISARPLTLEVRSHRQILEKPGKFVFTNLEEGRYVLSAFVDSDSNGVYSYGKLTPFKSSERFVYYNDTLKVRARWTQEGVVIRIK